MLGCHLCLFFVLASRTTGIGPEWARTRVASLGFELMVAARLLPLIVALLVFLALASRTTELCQTGASQPEWAWTRVASPVLGRHLFLSRIGPEYFLALASRTIGIGPEWSRTRMASPGFELMVATRLLPLIVALLVFLAEWSLRAPEPWLLAAVSAFSFWSCTRHPRVLHLCS